MVDFLRLALVGGFIMNCQICNHAPLNRIITLGYMPPVNWMEPVDTIHDMPEMPWWPTDLMHCPKCELVQLNDIPPSDWTFPAHYPYTSGSTRILRDNFEQQAEEAIGLLNLKSGSLVVDIGSNDGTLLKAYQKRGMRVLGIEPTDIADIANKNGIKTLKSFFDLGVVSQILQSSVQADLITCCNCFAHMPNPNGIVEAIKLLLKPDGTYLSESHYLIDLLNGVQYDTIYHEHLRYYSLRSLGNLFKRHGMLIDDAKRIPTHGGSIRVYASVDDQDIGVHDDT